MTYEDAGFNNLLSKNTFSQESGVSTEDNASYQTPQISGSNVVSGVSISTSGKIKVDWDKEFINISNGARDRVKMGNFDGTGIYGIRVANSKGNTMFEVSDSLQQISMFNTTFNELVRIDTSGFHAYDTSGNELIKVDSTGFHGYLTSGVETLRVSGSGIEGYGDTGNTFKFYDVQGGTQYGQIGYLNSGPYFYLSGTSSVRTYLTGSKISTVSTGTDSDATALVSLAGGMDILSKKTLDIFSNDESINIITGNNSGKGIYLKGPDTGNPGSSGVYFWNWDANDWWEILF